MTGAVVVVGSLNADLTLYAPRLPRPGETVAGTDFAVHPGGKSANQAVAAARLGAPVRLVGAVGDDANGTMLLDSVAAAGVDTSRVRRLAGVPTGVAGITVDNQGENSIVIVPGANGVLSPDDVVAARPAFKGAAVVCLVLEVAQETVLAAALAGRDAGATIILNLSPYAAIPAALTECIDVLVVNSHEAAQLLGRSEPESGEWDWEEARAALSAAGYDRTVVTLGPQGAVVLDGLAAGGEQVQSVEPTRVRAVDTTGAGDAFTGAVAARIAAGDSLAQAARYASVAAALATTKHGTQAAHASSAEVARAVS